MSKVKQKVTKVNRTEVKDLIENSTGKFVTITWTKNDGSVRTVNGKYLGTTKLGYGLVKERGVERPKSVDFRTTSELKANKQVYSVK